MKVYKFIYFKTGHFFQTELYKDFHVCFKMCIFTILTLSYVKAGVF